MLAATEAARNSHGPARSVHGDDGVSAVGLARAAIVLKRPAPSMRLFPAAPGRSVSAPVAALTAPGRLTELDNRARQSLGVRMKGLQAATRGFTPVVTANLARMPPSAMRPILQKESTECECVQIWCKA